MNADPRPNSRGSKDAARDSAPPASSNPVDRRKRVEGLSVGQTAARLGVTVRTLHHWDTTGLASPSTRTPRGYRRYTADDIVRLQRAVIYRELGLSLSTIKDILDGGEADPVAALRQQQEHVHKQIDRLHELSQALEHMIQAQENATLLTAEQQAEIFGPGWQPERTAKARELWGNTAQWAEYAERAASRTPEEWKALVADAQALEHDLATAMHNGVQPGSDKANQLAEQHRAGFSSYFYLTHSMHVCLGQMYDEDPEFAAYYDRLHPGLSSWLRQIIDENARANGVDPETAVWE